MFDVTEGQSDPQRIKQLSVFLENRVGALLSVTRCLEALGLRIAALSIIDSVDHSVARMVVDRPELAYETLRADGYSVVESELLGVIIPEDHALGIRGLLSTLLLAELNVHYLYPLLTSSMGPPVLAVHVEDTEAGSRVLLEKGYELVGQQELE